LEKSGISKTTTKNI